MSDAGPSQGARAPSGGSEPRAAGSVGATPRWHHRARRALAHSLRVRLVALFVLLALGMAATFLGGMQYALGIGWREAARPLVMDYVDTLALQIGSPPSVERAQALVQRLPLSVRISGPLVNWRSKPDEPDYEAQQHDAAAPSGRWDSAAPRFFERTTADGHRIRFGLNVQVWNDRPRFIGWVTLAVLLSLTALAYSRVRRMLRPLDDIRAGALRFGAGDFAQPIAVRHARHPDELGELAATINTMGADIHQMLEAKRALLLAISHELRSPLTRARLNTELLPESPDVQPSRDALLRDLALMRDLVTDLLESERLNAPHAVLHREPVDLAALAREVVAALPGAPAVQQMLDAPLAPMQLDPTRMRLLLRNLLDNALRHNAAAAQPPVIQLALQAGGAVTITVRDFGPGVPQDQLQQLGQPFFRPDAARTREGGGVGLGLYLCKLVAQAHGGSLTLRNAQPGLEIAVVLPAQLL
jgi:signal transduction histidine kinase